MARTALDLLQRPPKMLGIMVYLLERNEEDASSLISNLNLATYTFYSAVERLKRLGFLYTRKEKGWPPHTYVRLTSKGKEAAKLLLPLSKIVGDTILGLESELESLEGKERGKDENERMVQILKELQDISFTLGEWGETEAHAKRALDIASALGDMESLSKSLRTLGRMHLRRGESKQAKSEFSESLQISMKVNDLDGVAEAHYFIGAIHEQGGEYDKAMKEYKRAAETSKSTGDEVREARSKLGLGRMLAKKGKYRDSLKRIEESIATFERLEEDDELPRAYANAGSSTFFIDIDESLKWHERSMEMAIRNSDLRILGHCLCNVSGCLNKKGEPRKALEYLEEASMISKKLGENRMMCSVNIQAGWSHRLEKKWTDSNRCYEHAVQLAEKFDFPYELGDALYNWALVNIDRGDKNGARLKLKRAMEVFDKLSNQAKVNKIRRILRSLRPP
ncbi:MAG: tetratricopeptide repeat protein [Thermoplasmata archaeon]